MDLFIYLFIYLFISLRLSPEIGKILLMERDAPGVVGRQALLNNILMNASIHKSMLLVF